MKFLLYIFGVVFVLFGCRPDLETAKWEVDALAPLAKTRIDFTDLLDEDSSLVAGGDGLLSIVYRNKLASYVPGDIAPPLENKYQNTASINSINLGTRVIREQISLGKIAAQAGVVGQIIIASNGSNQAVPPVNGLGPSTFDVDATEFFETMTLRDGWLILRMENGLPFEVANLQYSIENKSGGTPLLQNTIPSLQPGAVNTDSVRLNNNITITGELVATLANVDIPGTNGNPVPIDTSDALLITLTVDKLDPISATAIFPAQTLYSDTATDVILANSAKLTRVHVKDGEIFLKAISTVDDIITLEYVVPSATKNGQQLGFIEKVPAAPPGGFSTKNAQFPIQDYDIDLTGLPNSMNVFNEFYTVYFAGVDSSGNLINLSLQDSVFTETGINNLIADRGYGFIGYDTSQVFAELELEVFKELLNSNYSFDNVIIEIELENYIGAPAAVQIFNVNSQTTGTTLGWNNYNTLLNIPKGNEVVVGAKPEPGRTTFKIDKSNSTIADFFTSTLDSIKVVGESYLNPNVSNTDLSQFIYTDYGVEAYLNVEVPLNLSISDLKAVDTTDFDYLKVDKNNRLTGGELRLEATNFYPFEVSVDVLLLDENKQQIFTLESNATINACKIDGDGRALETTNSSVDYPLSAEAIAALKETRFMVFSARFNTLNNPQKVKVYSDNYLDITLVGDVSVLNK